VNISELTSSSRVLPAHQLKRILIMKYALIIAVAATVATPALAQDVGVRVGPVGAGVTVGEGRRDYDRDRDHTTVIREGDPRPADSTTVIKKQSSDGTESKTVIHRDTN
jgi:hypothetical protein